MITYNCDRCGAKVGTLKAGQPDPRDDNNRVLVAQTTYDLCGDCRRALVVWLATPPPMSA